MVRWTPTRNGEAPEGGGGGTFPVGMEYDCPEFEDGTVSEQAQGASSGVGEQCGPDITFCWYELPAGLTPKTAPELKGTVNRPYNTVCTVNMDADRKVRARFDPVGGYAPRLIFHPGEEHWPADPATFLRRSKLAWSVGRSRRQQDCESARIKRRTVRDRGDFTATDLRLGKIKPRQGRDSASPTRRSGASADASATTRPS